jgi:hypothetical protein
MAGLRAVVDGGVLHHATHVLGAATELRATAELLERGFDVTRPVVDAGYDLLLDGRVRVQVKASRIRLNGAGGGTQYVFSFKRGLAADFLVCRGVEGDRWWIVPASVVPAGATSLSISPDPPNPGGRGRPAKVDFREYLDAWELLRG